MQMMKTLAVLLVLLGIGSRKFPPYAVAETIQHSEIPDAVAIQGEGAPAVDTAMIEGTAPTAASFRLPAGAYKHLKELSKRETIMQTIFGRDCYSQALLKVDRNCNQMTTEQKYKLAHAMNLCFLVSNGHAGYKCNERMTPSDCSKNLDDRAFSSYNMFFANIHSICLYVSNREFERHTSQLLNKLYEGAGAAQSVLQGVAQGLQVHQEQQLQLQHGIAKIREEQTGLAEGLREGLQRLLAIQSQADTLQAQVNRTLLMEEELSRRQGDLAGQILALEQLELERTVAAERRWEVLLQRAAAMEERQSHYEALQEALAASSSQLLQHSGQLQGAIETVLVAQQRTSSLLGRVLGGQWTVKDIAFYVGSAACIVLLTGPTSLQPSRLPLLALLFVTAACERALRQYLQVWLPLIEGAMGLPPVAHFPGGVDQAGWVLRCLSGLTACILLLRRLVATRRREAANRRVLDAIEEQLRQLTAHQAILTQHILETNNGVACAGNEQTIIHHQQSPPPLAYRSTANHALPALLAAPLPESDPLERKPIPVHEYAGAPVQQRGHAVCRDSLTGAGDVLDLAPECGQPTGRPQVAESPGATAATNPVALRPCTATSPSDPCAPQVHFNATHPQEHQQQQQAPGWVQRSLAPETPNRVQGNSKRKRNSGTVVDRDDGERPGRVKSRREREETGR